MFYKYTRTTSIRRPWEVLGPLSCNSVSVQKRRVKPYTLSGTIHQLCTVETHVPLSRELSELLE